ncbi:MAG: hypothetical protein FWD71_22875, partial [Oscillospiraceae bacterium]|nr:hypothetical protein [Oscillospiraceae bacterium]
DGSGKTKSSGLVGPIVYQDQQYIYRYGFDKNGDNTLIRTDLNNQNPQTLIAMQQNASDEKNGIENNLQDAAVVGDHIFYKIAKLDYSMTQGNFVVDISVAYCMMNTDGAGNKILGTVVYNN